MTSWKHRKAAIALAVSGAALATVALADQVINDDVIVRGRQCVGFDCQTGESFNFGRLKLKENNLRIHFDDTSTFPGFSNQDWLILTNDSRMGGPSKFSILDIPDLDSTGGPVPMQMEARTPFTIEAGARDDALYLDSSGHIGFGKSTPAVSLDMRDGDTPAVRLDQDGSRGWEPQIWTWAVTK